MFSSSLPPPFSSAVLTHLKQRSEWGEGGTLLLKVDKGFTFHVCKKKYSTLPLSQKDGVGFLLLLQTFQKYQPLQGRKAECCGFSVFDFLYFAIKWGDLRKRQFSVVKLSVTTTSRLPDQRALL